MPYDSGGRLSQSFRGFARRFVGFELKSGFTGTSASDEESPSSSNIFAETSSSSSSSYDGPDITALAFPITTSSLRGQGVTVSFNR
ncbi:uncharacterized protein PG986_006427 [Apiospora aurea]|uniref:Uncharacterized protein n=1 Tax=Apiospora aurea TaxID=335848 RepID=A0ABR1QKM0_9PEZI